MVSSSICIRTASIFPPFLGVVGGVRLPPSTPAGVEWLWGIFIPILSISFIFTHLLDFFPLHSMILLIYALGVKLFLTIAIYMQQKKNSTFIIKFHFRVQNLYKWEQVLFTSIDSNQSNKSELCNCKYCNLRYQANITAELFKSILSTLSYIRKVQFSKF